MTRSRWALPTVILPVLEGACTDGDLLQVHFALSESISSRGRA
jgi:hypothetical protein